MKFALRLALLLVLLFSLSACASGGGDSSESSSVVSTSGGSSSSGSIVSPSSRTIEFCSTRDPDQSTLASLSASFAAFIAGVPTGRSLSSLARETVTIPVFFHVISRGPSFEEGEVPDAFLQEQISILNRAYSGETGGVTTPFRFILSGINRVRNAEWHTMSPGSESEVAAKQELKIGGAESLNVYIADIELPEGQSEGVILGYATLPVFYSLLAPFDGVVLNFNALPGGPLPNYDLGHTLVHEVGHWLGLFHTFLGQCDGFVNDLVVDTPRELTPERGQYCPSGRDSCPGSDGADPIHNHMTYTGDACRYEFTQGQVDFMMFNGTFFRDLPLF